MRKVEQENHYSKQTLPGAQHVQLISELLRPQGGITDHGEGAVANVQSLTVGSRLAGRDIVWKNIVQVH